MFSPMTNIYKYNQTFQLESGKYLPEIEIAYTTYGKLNEDKSNVVWICHAFTANSDPAEWWPGMVGEGLTFDPGKHFESTNRWPGHVPNSSGHIPESGF